MKKVITFILISLMLLMLTGCGKTKFEDLSVEKQQEIIDYTLGVMAPELGKAMQKAFDFSLSEEEQNKNTAEFEKNIEKIFNEKIKTKYPNIIFGSYEDFNNYISKKDNSRVEIKVQEVKNYEKVKLGDFYEFKKGEKEKIKIKVNDIVWKGNEYGDYWIKTAKNEFLFIRLEGENTGKKPTFKWLGDVKLITKDGYEFSYIDTEQNPDNLKDGYSGCLECELNPLGKAEQWVVFDIPKIDLSGALLRFENDLVDFEL